MDIELAVSREIGQVEIQCLVGVKVMGDGLLELLVTRGRLRSVRGGDENEQADEGGKVDELGHDTRFSKAFASATPRAHVIVRLGSRQAPESRHK
jgi:hypothetical protein